MRIHAPYRAAALTLIAVTLLFHAGVPVTVYLCPMMSSDSPTCEMSVPSFGNTPSITKQTPSCCSKYIIAESNSIPYLKSENTPGVDLAVAICLIDQNPDPRDGWSAPVLLQDAGPPRSSPPLYILSSSFLI